MGVVTRSCLYATITVITLGSAGRSQEPSRPPAKGWEVVGLPALNFDSDEGFGYGVLAEAYNYGNGARPYKYTIQPTVFFTTKGRRDFVVFFDAPTLLPHDVRLDAFAGREQQLATPYYGIGNDAGFNDQLQQPPNAYYYRYGRTQVRLLANLQHGVARFPARVLVGAGFADVRTNPTPFDSGTTLLAQQLGGAQAPRGRIAYLRTGLVWDTRDREIAPHAGSYGDLLVQRVDRALGASSSYTRFTAIGRHYFPLAERLTLAQRAVVQQVSGDVPLYDIATIQTSYKQHEGLGGSTSIRGLPKNRFVGKGLVMLNTDLRWRFAEFTLRHKPAHLVLSGFGDVGRVWSESIKVGELAKDLNSGYGGGLRVGLGPSFVVALDVGRSPQSNSTQIYIGLGYPF
jgi:outer membrane protein assembly factor BamA